MTNENKIMELISMNHTVLNALLWERILKMEEITREAIKQNPEAFNTPFTSVKDWLSLLDSIKTVDEMEQPAQSQINVLFMDQQAVEFMNDYEEEHPDDPDYYDVISAMAYEDLNMEVMVAMPSREGLMDVLSKASEYDTWIYLPDSCINALRADRWDI